MNESVKDFLLHVDELSPVLIFGFFFLSGFLQIAFPPYPGDTALVFGGCLGGVAGGAGTLALLGYLSATVATSLALYELGYRLTDRIFAIPLIGRVMPLAQRASVEKKYKRFGVGLLALCKFIPGVNTLVILLGGVLRYPRPLGMGAIALSSVAHNLIFFWVGHTLGRNLEAIEGFVREYTLFALLACAALTLAIAAYFIIKGRKTKNNEKDSSYRG